MAVLLALLLVLLLMVCWLLTVAGMPGNWLLVAFTTIYMCLVPADSRVAIGWTTIATLLVLATLGEIIETVAGAFGVAKAGGTRRGALMALAGSIVGGFLGIFIGMPIPFVGSLIASVLFAGIGAMVGAIIGETSAGQRMGATWQIAKLAFWGRLAGTCGKILVGAMMVAVVLSALIL
jgi:uncharacterized protein YqgC (DUF456 family)